MRFYTSGFRTGMGRAAAVVRPPSLVALWRVAQACIDADAVLILQAANTGLTGGSTPRADGYERPAVVISTVLLDGIHLLGGGRQVLCLPGARLHALEARLRPLGREPHSVIGSSCFGASVVGGVCNNSGGALVRRGPAYTELALFGRVGEDGRLRLVNRLGIRLEGDTEAILEQVERGNFSAEQVMFDCAAASDPDYQLYVRDIDAESPARFNADPRRLKDASGSAGRVVVFAVRLDTFVADETSAVFYLGTDNSAALAQLRRAMLSDLVELPIAAEYIHRDAFELAVRYGKDIVWATRMLGANRLPRLFEMKRRIDFLAERLALGELFSERLLQQLSRLLPRHLPSRLAAFGSRYEHHLLLKVGGKGIAETRRFLEVRFTSTGSDWFECTPREASLAFLHRFAVAGASIRFCAVHSGSTGGMIALDIALPRNLRTWFETLEPSEGAPFTHKIYYGHFLCHVFHQDFVLHRGSNVKMVKQALLTGLDEAGARYPAEHNVGHCYDAGAEQAAFYRELDPLNCLNPGIGNTSSVRRWGRK